MYRVELLQSATTHLTPGWTYVPDRGFNPAKAAITPTVGRKRGIRDPGGRGDVSSRQTNAILRHLAELDRENHKDVHVPIPVKQKDAAARAGTRTKVTSNVRRILQSQKSFRNYLDDEEAALAQSSQSTTQRPPANKITKPSSLRRSSTPATTPKPTETSRQRKKSAAVSVSSQKTSTIPTEPPSANAATAAPTEDEAEEKQRPNELIKSEHDNDPLLKSYLPSAPSDRIMQALLAEPPLTYNASRAGPPFKK
ncbi:hypothetical protein BBP40_011421 [Aspergillus hancockii]|nr:hypothetical protein BBP40_011421 [Aspergillus hancockii]